MPPLTYESLSEFYGADLRRLGSREVDFGVWWRDRGHQTRVSWVEDTGEVIAVRLTPGEKLVEVVGVVATLADLERFLTRWTQLAPWPDSVAWVRERLVSTLPVEARS